MLTPSGFASLSTTVIVGLRTPLDIADIGPVDAGLIGERLLAQPRGEAQAAQVLPKR